MEREMTPSTPPEFGPPTGSGASASVWREIKPPPPSPPGLGAAAAGPYSTRFGGSKSATRTNMLVDVKIEADHDDLEVLRHVGNKNASPAEGAKRKFVADATNGAQQGVNVSNTKKHPHSCKKGKGSVKRAKLEENKGATGLGRVQTPVGLFKDECVFCHSFRTSEECHGPMVLYHNRRIVPSDEGNPTNAIYVHKKCMVWAPKVKSHGDTFKNVESEIRRASGLKCSRCKIQGAALRCYRSHCRSTYHFPCAMMIPECRWDDENRYVWCPKHATRDDISSPTIETDILSPILINQCPAHTPVDHWVFLAVSLSPSEKDSLKKFASLTNSTLAEEWDKNVTHVIVGRNTGDACGRSYEVLMAILSGKWVVSAGWIVDCLVEPVPVPKTSLGKLTPGPEISYEMNLYDGPRKGRVRAAKGAPKLFSGLHFCLSAYMDPEDKETIGKLIEAGEGQVLEGISPDWSHENLKRNPSEVYFIYDFCPPRTNVTPDFDVILGNEIQKSKELGSQVISYTRLFDAIRYNASMGPVGSGRTQKTQRRPAK